MAPAKPAATFRPVPTRRDPSDYVERLALDERELLGTGLSELPQVVKVLSPGAACDAVQERAVEVLGVNEKSIDTVPVDGDEAVPAFREEFAPTGD